MTIEEWSALDGEILTISVEDVSPQKVQVWAENDEGDEFLLIELDRESS